MINKIKQLWPFVSKHAHENQCKLYEATISALTDKIGQLMKEVEELKCK